MMRIDSFDLIKTYLFFYFVTNRSHTDRPQGFFAWMHGRRHEIIQDCGRTNVDLLQTCHVNSGLLKWNVASAARLFSIQKTEVREFSALFRDEKPQIDWIFWFFWKYLIFILVFLDDCLYLFRVDTIKVFIRCFNPCYFG